MVPEQPLAPATERARPGWVREHPQAWRLALLTVCFGAFMGQLDASVVTLTYRSVGREFHVGSAAVQWVSLAYLVPLAALLVYLGQVSDRLGRKRVYLWGFSLFTAASLGCALAPSLGVLLTFRGVQAVGAGMLQANSVALVVTSAPRARIRAALGVQAAAQAIGLALGPTVGGVIVDTMGWRWVFAINVPVGVVALLAGRLFLPRTRRLSMAPAAGPVGVVLLAGVTTALLLGISGSSGLGLSAAGTGALLVTAAVIGAAFAWQQRRSAAPLIEPRVLAAPGILAGLVGATAAYLLLFGPLVLVPSVLAGAHASTVQIGLVLAALPAGFAVAASASEAVLPRRWSSSRRSLLGAGIVLVALGILLAAGTDRVALVAGLGCLGVGLGAWAPPNNAAIMSSVPAQFSGSGGGLVNTARAFGTALGVALVTLALHQGGAPVAWAMLLGVGLLGVLSVLLAARRGRR